MNIIDLDCWAKKNNISIICRSGKWVGVKRNG